MKTQTSARRLRTQNIFEEPLYWEGEAPAEPKTTAGRRPPEASYRASGGRRAKARIRLGGSLALPFQSRSQAVGTRLRSGLSLIEVLISLALSALLLGSVYSAITMYFHYSAAGQEEVEKNQLARVLLQRIETDLRSIVYRAEDVSTAATDDTDATTDPTQTSSSTTTDSTSETVTQEVQDPSAAFTGSSSGLFGDMQTIVLHVSRPRLDLLSSQALNMVNSRTSDLKTVSYFVAGNGSGGLQAAAASHFSSQTNKGPGGSKGLARMEGDRLALQMADKSGNTASLLGQTQMLAPEVSRVGFRYWNGSTWAMQWDSASMGGLPRAVEVTIEMTFSTVDPNQSRFRKKQKVEPPRTYRSVVALPIYKPIVQTTM